MEGIIVRRVIPSDNSCLFNAIGYVMDKDKNKAPELRQVCSYLLAFFDLLKLLQLHSTFSFFYFVAYQLHKVFKLRSY
jgi:hypothetical protein